MGSNRSMDFLVVQPGETLGGLWFTYQAHAGAFSNVSYPAADSLTLIGIELRSDQDLPLDPLINASGDWLWWEPITWQTTQAASTEFNATHYAFGPRTERKIQAQRKAPATTNALLTASFRTDQSNASADFVNAIRVEVAVSALIILP